MNKLAVAKEFVKQNPIELSALGGVAAMLTGSFVCSFALSLAGFVVLAAAFLIAARTPQ